MQMVQDLIPLSKATGGNNKELGVILRDKILSVFDNLGRINVCQEIFRPQRRLIKSAPCTCSGSTFRRSRTLDPGTRTGDSGVCRSRPRKSTAADPGRKWRNVLTVHT
jgi:hypothetical protein